MSIDRDAVLDELARLIRKRRGGCPVLLGVELASAGIALGLTQADIDEAERRAAVVAAAGFVLAIGLVWFEGRFGHPREK